MAGIADDFNQNDKDNKVDHDKNKDCYIDITSYKEKLAIFLLSELKNGLFISLILVSHYFTNVLG